MLALARRLEARPVDVVLSAPSVRALESARIVAEPHGLDPVVDDELREVHHGAFEGRNFAVLAREGDEVFREFGRRRSWSVFPGGEENGAFRRRCRAAVEAIVERHGSADTVVVVSHGGVINAMLAELLRLPDAIFFMPLSGSVSSVRVDEGQATVVTLNDCRHLADLLLTRPLPLIHPGAVARAGALVPSQPPSQER